MRIQQLEYLEKIVETGSINEAAKNLYLTQPSLSNAVKELESEMAIKILDRSKNGVTLTESGREFMVYARQVLDQVGLLQEKYQNQTNRKKMLSVSSQHYAFVVHAFVALVKAYESNEYHFTLRETETQNILEDVSSFRSELGILYLNDFNRKVMEKLFKEKDLIFEPLFEASPHIFVSRHSPLAQKESVDLEDLVDYPYLSFEQGEHNSFYFAEEILSTLPHKKEIKVSDRATIFNLMIGLNGYTISSGIISRELNDEQITAIPLNVPDRMEIGWIRHKRTQLSKLGERYLKILQQQISEL